MDEEKKDIPRAIFNGVLQIIDGVELPCYVLDDGRRVFSTSGMLTGLGYSPKANVDEIFSAKDLKPFLPPNPKGIIIFNTGGGKPALGYDVEGFMDLCHSYSKAIEDEALVNKRHIEAAKRANAFIRACSKIGIIALVDEVTGYQYARAENELQFKLKLFLSEEMRGWEKTFPDDLWVQLARLTHWGGNPAKNRPRHWGYFVMSLIYQSLDPDVASYLKENKPEPKKGQNYHQWFNEDYGVRKLREHINRIVGMAQACESIEELKQKVDFYYKKQPLQLELFMNKDNKADQFKIKMPFDEAIKKIAKGNDVKENAQK